MINKRNSFNSKKPINFMVRFGKDTIKVNRNQLGKFWYIARTEFHFLDWPPRKVKLQRFLLK